MERDFFRTHGRGEGPRQPILQPTGLFLGKLLLMLELLFLDYLLSPLDCRCYFWTIESAGTRTTVFPVSTNLRTRTATSRHFAVIRVKVEIF